MVPQEVANDGSEQLLAGPRGRAVCLEVARRMQPTLDWPFNVATSTAADATVAQLDGFDPALVTELEDPYVLMDALGRSVDLAMYWQEPDQDDQVLQQPQVLAALEPVARALVACPAAAWWWSPVDIGDQAVVRWLGRGRERGESPQLAGAPERLQRWRSETIAEEARAAKKRPAAFDANYSGSWWSTPVPADITTTSRRLGRLPAVQLELVEDFTGWERARVATVHIQPDRRVLEIRVPSDWTGLVDTYPLDVDRSRRHDWWRATSGTGPWQIPDWSAVSRDYDGVHLSVIGYLSTAGRALSTQSGQTVLAGFDPDLTYWLTDSLEQVATPTTWRRADRHDSAHAWVPETTAPEANQEA